MSESTADRSGDGDVALWDMKRRCDSCQCGDSLDDWSSGLIRALTGGMFALTPPVPLRETDGS